MYVICYRKQLKREHHIERARQALLRKQTNQESEKRFHVPSYYWNVNRDYIKHEPLFRYIENVKLNFYDHLTPKQKKRIDKKYQEMKKQEEMYVMSDMDNKLFVFLYVS